MTALLFVYGTLKDGFPNQSLNSGRRVPGDFRTRVAYPLYVVQLPHEARAPWLVDDPGRGHRVLGQVFEVDAAALQAMDAFEETHLPTGYQRVTVELEPADPTHPAQPTGTPLQASVYMKRPHQLADCVAMEGPFAEYTLALAAGYRLQPPGPPASAAA